jgi:hypothetical protein
MQWIKYKKGRLASCKHGIYFIEKIFDYAQGTHRWFVEYDHVARSGRLGKTKLAGRSEGYETLKAARAYCEQVAQDLESLLP